MFSPTRDLIEQCSVDQLNLVNAVQSHANFLISEYLDGRIAPLAPSTAPLAPITAPVARSYSFIVYPVCPHRLQVLILQF